MTCKQAQRPRTTLQNRSLHVWFRQAAEYLNDAGLDAKKVLSNKNNQKVIGYLEQAIKLLKGVEQVGAVLNVVSGAICILNKCVALLESASEVSIPWDKEGRMVKELLYRPVMEAMTGEDSTTKLDTIEPSVICDVVSRHLGENFGVTLPPWPTRWELMNESRNRTGE